MKRIIKIKTRMNEVKFVLREECEGFGLYQEQTPSGYFVNQSWLISDNEKNELVVESYNNQCKEEVLDMIDNMNATGSFGVRATLFCGSLFMHPCGKLLV